MSVEQIFNRYPTLCKIAFHPALRDDIAKAETAAKIDDGKGMWDAYKAGQYIANELTFTICLHEFGGFADGVADEIEANLKTVVAAIGEQKVRAAYHDKLLVDGNGPFTDVRYEIAAAAAASTWLDAGTLQLEANLGGAKKNSDLAGKRNGLDVRLEVRVVHDNWPPRIDEKSEQMIMDATVPSGFIAKLRFLPDLAAATRIKHVVEELHRLVVAGSIDAEKPVVVDGIEFYPDLLGSGFTTQNQDFALSELAFEGDQDERFVDKPIFTRSMIDPQELEWINNPEGVHVFSGELADPRTYKAKPLSTKVGAAIAGKVRQCADDACNIVILGTPSPMADHDVDDAVHGAMAATYIKASDGSFVSTGAKRKPSAMFVPAAKSENADNLVYPYQKISGVWHIRLGYSAPESRVFRNPNASNPLVEADANALAATLPRD